MVALFNPTRDRVIAEVGQAWVQDNQSRFGWPEMPLCLVPSLDGSFSGKVTFPLPPLATFLNSTLQPWTPGQSKPQPRQVGESTFNINVQGYGTLPLSYVDGLSGPQRLLWMAQRMPALLSELWQAMDKTMAAFLANATNFGAAKTFTGGPLQDPTLLATQNPISNIQRQTQSLRKYASPQFEFVCIMDQFVADVLRQHPAYTGAAYTDGATAVSGAGVPAALEYDAFIAKFRAIHGFERVTITKTATNNAVAGATADIKSTTSGLLWMGLLARQKTADLRMPKLSYYPDGAFTLAIGRMPQVRETRAERERVVFVDGEVEYGWNAIRGSDFGIWWDPTTIFLGAPP